MNYVIENQNVKVEIADLGAELQSIIGKKTGTEYLWQGDVNLWKNKATVLFPICGRLFQGKYTWKGKEYEMPLHGFVKNCVFSIDEQTKTKIVFKLTADAQTKTMYPFEFTFKVSYELVDRKVVVNYVVENDNEEVLPFSCGGHPGFNVPFNKGENFEDYYLEFNKESSFTRIETSSSVLFTGNNIPYPLKDGKVIELSHDLFDDDAIFLNDKNCGVNLKCKKNDREIRVTYDDVTHVGFWHTQKKPAPFVCIEPWHGVPAYDGKLDDFATKNEMIQLPKGQKYIFNFNVEVVE